MASLCGRLAISTVRKSVLYPSIRVLYPSIRCATTVKVTMGDPLEHATGLEKRELLAQVAGNENPFDMKILKRNAGTKAQPNEIPSAFDARIVGCVCEEDATSVNWMWLYKGQPRRCECGHWFTLVQKAPV